MPVQHAVLSGADTHECKQISTANTGDAGKVITPSSVTAGIATLRYLSPADLDHTNPANNICGYNIINDSLYTSGSPRALTSGVRVKITNDGLAAGSDQSRLGAVWNTTNNRLTLTNSGSSYTLTVRGRIAAAAAAGTPYALNIELDAGGVVIAGHTFFIKGGAATNFLSHTFKFYVGAAVLANPIEIFITPDTAMTLWSTGLILQEEYREF